MLALPGFKKAEGATTGLVISAEGHIVTSAWNFDSNPNDFKEDAWGTNYTYTGGVTIASTGSGSTLTKAFAGASSDFTANSVVGSVVDGRDNPPGTAAASVSVKITYPDGAGSTSTTTVNPNAGGSFAFSGTLPVGHHEVNMMYLADTIARQVTVLPNSTLHVDFRLPGDPWGP